VVATYASNHAIQHKRHNQAACFVFSSRAEDADTSSFDLEVGDIILTATDGLFDNMSDSLILKELEHLKVSRLLCHHTVQSALF